MGLITKIKRKTIGSLAIRWSRMQMQRHRLNELFADRPSDAIAPQPVDLWNLYREVAVYKPQRVLEFGVGYSTSILAEALHRNGAGHLYSVDADARWLEASKLALPERLWPHVTFIRSPVVAMDYQGERCHRYTDVPELPYDLIYLDAPAPGDVQGWPDGMEVVAADPVLMEMSLTPAARIVVDGRLKNVEFLKRHLQRQYRVCTNTLFKVTTFAPSI